jgi:hypothetical protein
MSLLLEALKKAEKAKEDAQRRARNGNGGGEPEPSVFDSDATVATDGRHVMRRDELPDISAPLEILSDDLRPPAQPKAAAPLELMPTQDDPPAEPKAEPRRAAAPRASSNTQAAGASGAERAAAQKVFEAKFREPNPRLPFYIVMGFLGVFAVGTAIYFYIQLRPPPALVNTNPARPPTEKPVEVAADKGAAAPAPATQGSSASGGTCDCGTGGRSCARRDRSRTRSGTQGRASCRSGGATRARDACAEERGEKPGAAQGRGARAHRYAQRVADPPAGECGIRRLSGRRSRAGAH